MFFTVDGGHAWIQLKGGLPTIAVRDIAIQKRESDLVLATFGRGFYVLDDFTPLRDGHRRRCSPQEAALFPLRAAPMYVPEAAARRPRQRLPGRVASSWRRTRRSARSSPTT